jgi:hypothetical protein
MCQQFLYQIANFICYYLSSIKSADLLTFIALLLALLAYRKSILDRYDSWKALLQSFLDELKSQSSWIGGIYNNTQDKMWYSPNKIVFLLSFESSKEIARRGISDLRIISKELYEKISLFNERVDAFNKMLEYQKSIICANPPLANKLQDFLEDSGLNKANVLSPQFSLTISNLQKNGNGLNQDKLNLKQELYSLAMQLYLINNVIHNQIIGNASRPDSLNYLYNTIKDELSEKLKNFETSLPFYFRKLNFILLIFLSIFLFLFIEKHTL